MFEVWLQMSDTNIDTENPSDLPALFYNLIGVLCKMDAEKDNFTSSEEGKQNLVYNTDKFFKIFQYKIFFNRGGGGGGRIFRGGGFPFTPGLRRFLQALPPIPFLSEKNI